MFLSLGSSSSSSPSEVSEGPASDGSSVASATGGSNQHNGPSVSAAAGSSQAATGPKSSAPVTTPAPRITPLNNGPLPLGFVIVAAKPPLKECDSESYLLLQMGTKGGSERKAVLCGSH